MDIFALDKHVIDDYQEFARSCVTIRTADLRQKIDDIYQQNAQLAGRLRSRPIAGRRGAARRRHLRIPGAVRCRCPCMKPR